MAAPAGWVTANKATELLGIDKKTLFKLRDNGTLRLGPDYVAFDDTFSRDSYRWNLTNVRKQLRKKAIDLSTLQ
jgi:aspartate ammonia-lyase